MSAAATTWNDYTLQTDHYVVAYYLAGGYFENHFYYQSGSSCDSLDSDCSYWPGGGDYYIASASIYLGSTLIDQSAAPDEGEISTLDSVLQNPTGKSTDIQARIDKWKLSLMAALELTVISARKHPDIKFLGWLDVIRDCQPSGIPHRERKYALKDTNGHLWNSANPILVGENINVYEGGPITGGGRWGTPGLAVDHLYYGSFDDDLDHTSPAPQRAIQQLWASKFNTPSDLSYPKLDPIFGLGLGTVPLPINDQLSTVRSGIWGTLDNYYGFSYIGINDDGGQSPNVYYLVFAGQIRPTKQSCY